MSTAIPMIELWRGGMLESVHHGHAVIWGPGGIEAAWGDPDAVIYPRSSCKMLQALPLIESGAADVAGLGQVQLALACASHSGGAIHTDAVQDWIAGLGLSEADFRCGVHMPWDSAAKARCQCGQDHPNQFHNNCSGKHAGFLTLNQHLKGDSDYVALDHPVQQACRAAFEDMVGQTAPHWGIDGCSAPNFACSIGGLAQAMQRFASARSGGSRRDAAAERLTQAMMAHPELVAAAPRACTRLMRAAKGQAAVKTGAEAVYVAILPQQRKGIALKITDGATRASEAAICALLLRCKVIDPADPVVESLIPSAQTNWRGKVFGEMRCADGFA
ncbi:L-asparaginase [Thioclava sp. SK-1]|uniref:asparaginase n=1 Tax=Thioclava sp. SK-1 TaxID=1889770 RepID=UPI000826D3BA|nr:asparaginase [Thioclava sp. SK-1]OCX65771.1 L-asparaginase [Thioclava sp. SK-1]